MNENEVKKLYTALINKGFSANDIGDENTFVAKMGDQNARKQFYDAISKTSFKIGDYDTFEKRLTSSAQVEQPTSTLKSTELFNVIPVKDSTAERDETYSITNPSQSASAEQPYAEHRVPTYGEGEYATGFGQGFKQGWKGLKEGVKYFVGETANLISGSSQDDAGALKRFDELQQSGQELQQPLLSRKDRRYHKQMSGAESVTVPMEFQYDEKGMPIPGTGRVLTEEEKQKHRDILQNDEYNQLISDAITAAGGDLSQARRILAARAEDKTWGDRLMESASEEMAKIKPTKGMGAWVGNLIPQMIPAASSMMLSVVTKNPKYLKYIGGLGMGTMSVSTAGQSMKEARDAGADNAQVWAVGVTNAAIDYATEKIPFDRYTTRLFNGTKKNVAQELSEAVADNTSPARAELEKLLIAANKKLGGRLLNGKNAKDFAGDILAEGVSEFTAEALQTITPMIYENPEDYPTISEIINNGWEGAKAGLFMGSVLGGASKTLEHRQNRSRRKQQGYVDVVQVATNKDGISDIGEVIGVKDNGNLSVLIDGSVEEVAPHKVQERHKFTFDEFDKAELQMELDESHDNGYSLSTPQEMNDAQNTYDLQREKALSLFYEEVLDKIEAAPIMYLDAYSGEHRDVLLDYINAKQVRDGMIQRVRDDIDSRIEESNTMVDSRTNTDTGMIQGATMKVDDRKVYVVKGNLVQYDDKSGINNSASSESVIIRDAQTGKIEIVSPDAILGIDDAIDPNEEKATAAEVIRTTYAQAEADKMEGKLTFNPGDTYTLDTENGQIQVQITANEQGIVDNGDGTINVTDGQNIFPVTKQTFQDQVDAANKARVAQYDALQQAERSMENTPEYALNDKVVLRDANGNTINGQIAEVFADDGYYIVDVDVPINGSYAARMTRDELNNMLVEHNGVNVNTPSVPAQQAQSAPVTPAPSQQAQTPAAPQSNTALSRIPKDAQGNPIYEQTDADTAWDAIVEQTEGDEAMAQSVAESMLKDKQTALSKAEKMQVKGGVTIAEKIAAEKEHKAIIANAQREVELWQQIAGTVQRRQAAAEVQRKIEEEKRRIAEEAAAQQAKVEEEQPQVQTNQEELVVEDSEQEVADVASESEEKIDDSTIGEQITEQETPVQAEEQVQSEESPAESQVTEQAETPTSAQPKESKNAKKLRKRAEKWMKDTGVTVRLLNSIDEVTNKSARAVIEAGNPVSGWFSNNEVVLYMPNINSVEEIDKTFIHEVVAHKGLRMLMGEKFDALCDNVWDMMSEEDRAKYINYPGVKGNIRKAADEYMAYLAEGVDLNKTIWQKIIDAVKEFFSSKDVTLLDEEIANLIKESYKNLKAQAATNVDNEVASIDGNDAMFSIKTYREGGRDILQKFLKGRVKAKDLTKAEAEEMLNQMDEIYAICEEFKDKYAPFGNWSEAAVVVDEDGKPVFSVIKPNGDYAMNLDFSLVCKKRRTLDAVFREMINRGIISDYDLGQVDIAKINDIIRKYGFETACRLCFVDAKRFRVAMVADAFVGIYNPLTKMTDQQLQNVSKQMGDATEGKIARMLLKNPENRIQLSRDNFMDSKGFEDIKANKAKIMSLYNAKKGTGGPKAALGDVQYLNDILKRRWSPKTAYSVGGVRLQSFSDYVPRMVFDYIQMIADLAAKKLPVHSYTKEVLFAQTFGLTGMKINLSLVPKVVEGGLAPGLDAEGNYAWQEGETFPYEEAMKLQNAEGYKENCGTIAVGVSDEHIQKLLDDDNIRMVIPYHKSGLNKQVAIHNNIDQFVDYTNEQNTRNADGKKLSEEQAKKHFNFNSDLQKHGNPRKAAENYLEWCRKNNYLPKFDKFQNHPNYYKLLEDFTTCITENGVDTFVPQGAVKMNFPTNESAFGSLSELIERGLEEDAILEGMKSEKIGPIVDDIQKALDEGQTMFRISEEQDKAYIDAVEAGDMETAQAMVDSAAQAAGYNSPRLYHGTKSEFNVFNAKHNDPGSKGFFFTDSEEMASSYGKNIKQVYLRVEDPYVIEGNGRNWNNLHTDIFSVIPEIEDQIRAHEIAMKRFLENGDIKQSQYDYFRDKYYDKVDFIKDESKNSIFDIIKKYIYRWQIRNFNSKLNVDRTRDFEWLLQQLDSDVNIIFKDITDYGANITDYESIFTPHDVYVTTNPKNIKSADAVTYDDNGNVIPLSERFNEENDDIRFRSDFGNNSGYTQRDNGNRISRRAKEAESEGSFTAGTFRKMYGVSKKDFDILEELGVIKVTEWHHTGANFAKNNFYTWADSSRITENGSDYSNGEIPQGSLAEKYKENKKEIAKLAKEYEESKWEYKPKTGKYIIPTIEQYAERMANEYSFEETPYLSESEKEQIAKEHQEISNSGKSSHERYTDHQSLDNKTRNEIVNRLLNNEELGLKDRYESDVRPQREHNEQVEEYNQRVNEYNSNTNGKEKALLDIANLLGFEISQDVLESKSQINRRKERLAEAREKANAKLIEKNEAISQMESDLQKWVESQKKNGKIVVRERISEKDMPENFVIEKKEMKGRYGWFDATIRYNLPVYYSGLEFSSKRLHDSYMNKRKEIRETDIRLTDEYNDFYNEVFKSSQEDEGISFRIRQITDKERQTMINALSLSEGEEFYDNVFNGADQVVRENIVAIAAKNGWDFRKATEEYLGSLADNNPRFDEVKQIGLWDKVKGFFVDMLNKIGLNGFTKDSLADNDLRYILWRRFKNPKGRQDLFEKAEDIAKQYELGVGDYAEEDGDTLFRTNSSIRDRYDRAVRVPNKSGSVKWHENSLRRLKEAYYDGMHALKKLQDLIAEETGKPIQSYENSYEAENHMSSENKAQAEIFERDFFNPLKKVVQSLIALGSSYEKLKTYIIAKHGLERNAYMRNKAVQNGENGDRDFSGLTDLTGIKDVADAEIEAQRIVDEYEKKYDTTELWEKINAATKETLRKSYDSGLISKETYEEVRDMYKYYIPLRGWDIDVASDEYEYLNSGRIMLSPALNKAKGRTSLADDPLATIGFMAESTIIQGNRNKVKMKFLNMALNHPTDLISVSEQWYVLDNATGEWEPRNPIIPDGATGDQVAAIVEQHEQQMIALGDKATKIKDGLKLNKNITKREGQEHVVRVKRNGKEYCLYINGSPRAAQAINGLLNPDINNSGLKKVANAIKHWMAAMFTSKNPTFIFLNLSRDVIWAGTSVAIKENAAYNARYTKNIAECLLKAQLPRLLKKFQNGTLDMNNELERYFDEFIRNGGETGFTQLHGVDDYKRNINRFVEEAQGKGFIVKKTWDGMIDNIEFMNRCAEDTTRFMVYMTSRQMGRDVMTSVTDAKEITVNFNRKGSGGLGASLFNFCYLFFNASIQSAANFGKLLVKHPKKSAIALTLFSSAGFLVPMLNMAIKAMFSDDEDDNSYWDLPEWIRRNNIVLYVPWTESGYLTIPVPHELRPFYGMGEIAFSCLMGKEDVEDGLKKASLGFTQIIPLDFTGNGGNFWVNITPTIAQPIAQIITNKDYFGKPIYKKNDWNERSPEWTKAYKSTTPWLIDATKWLNEISGGDNVKKGKIDLNPALIEHIFESYTGGAGKTLNNAQKTFAMLWNEDLREWRNVPIIGSFYRTTEEQTAGSQINREYYEAVEEMKDVQHLVNGYKRELRMGNLEYAEKIDELINSEIFKRYGVIYEFSKAIKEASDYLKLIDDTTDREKIETGIMNLKVDMFKKLEEINKVEELKNAEIAEEGNDDRK